MHHSPEQIEEETKRYFQKVYLWMFVGLAVSGAIAYYVANSEWKNIILGNMIIFWGLIIFELILVFSLVGLIKKMSAGIATLLFLLYSFVTGLTLSAIFIIYTNESIFNIFLISALMFAVISFYGYVTKKDLTKMGQILIIGLIGIIIASVVNIFLKSSAFQYVLSWIGVVIFTGLIAYDTQKLKKMNIIGNEGTDEDRKEAIIGALTLYLDLINLFLRLLYLFGKRR